MTPRWYRYKSDFARSYFYRGQVTGKANALLAVLRCRGIAVDSEVVERVVTYANIGDIGQLEEWLERAATAQSADDVFCY